MMINVKSLKERIQKNFRENKVLLIVFSIVWVATIICSLIYFDSTIAKQSIGNESYNRSVVEINENVVVEEIVPVQDKAESVSILFATYARNNEGNLNIKVEGINSNIEYISKSYDVKTIQDNAYITTKLNQEINTKNDKKIKITISSDSEEGKAVGLYYSNGKEFENSKLIINTKEYENNDLCFKYLIDNPELRAFSNGIIIFTIIAITFVALLALLFNPKEEVIFALSAFLLGLVMMIIIVPGSPSDELSHYEVVLQLSNKMMFVEDYHMIDSVYLKYGYMYGHYNISPGYVRFINEFLQPLKMTGVLVPCSRDIDTIYQLQYIPQALGITIGRLLKFNMITTFYCGRLTSLLFYVGCIYLAIKNVPSYKHLFGFLATLPMFLQIGIAISYDCFILGLSFVIISYFLKWYFEDNEISMIDFIIVFIACFGIAPAKVLYSFFAFLYIFVPKKRYGNTLKKILMCLIICAPSIYQLYGIMSGPITIFFNTVLKSNANENNNVITASMNGIPKLLDTEVNIKDGTAIPQTPAEVFSFKFMIRNPIETIAIFARTIRYRIKYWFYGSLGRCLSGETLVLPLRIVQIMAGLTIISSFVKQDYVLPMFMKAVLICMCIVIGLYAMIGMFVSWTDPNQTIIEDFGGLLVEGIQGRYFSPVLPYFYPIFANKKFALPKKTNLYVLLSYLVLFFVIVMYVLSYTFVN